MLPGFEKRMSMIIKCGAIATMMLHMTAGAGLTSVRYIMEAIAIYPTTETSGPPYTTPKELHPHICYSLGNWPIYWDKHNKIPVYPAAMSPYNVVEMHETQILRGGVMTDYEQQLLDEIKDTQNIDTIRNMLNADGKYDRDLLLSQGRDVYEIETLSTIMDELTMFRKTDAIQDYFLMDWTVEQWRNAHQRCINANYPKEAKPIRPHYTPKPSAPKKEPTILKGVKVPQPSRLAYWPKDKTETVLELALEFWVMSTKTQETYLTSMDVHEKQKIF